MCKRKKDPNKIKFNELNIGDRFEIHGDEHLNYPFPKVCKCIKKDIKNGQEIGGIAFRISAKTEVKPIH